MEQVNIYNISMRDGNRLTWCPEKFIENWKDYCRRSQTIFYCPGIHLVASFMHGPLHIQIIKNEIKNYLDILDRTDLFISEKEQRPTLLSWRYFPKIGEAHYGNLMQWKTYETKGLDVYNLDLLDKHLIKHNDGVEYYHIFGE